MRDDTRELPPQPCLACGEVVEVHTSLDDRPPGEGEVVICVYCGHVMCYDAALRFAAIPAARRREVEQSPVVRRVRWAIRQVQRARARGNN